MSNPLSDCCNEPVLGHQVPGAYDGVLYWSCEKCNYAWPRKFGFTIRDQLSQYYADAWNRGESPSYDEQRPRA